MLLRIAVCDDSAVSREGLAEIIDEWAMQRNLNVQVTGFQSAEELLMETEDGGYYGIVLMEIRQKNGIDGITAAAKLRKISNPFCLIFLSGELPHVSELFGVHPFQCLTKPVPEKKLLKCLDEIIDNYWLHREIFVFRFKNTIYSVRLQEVVYFCSDRRVIRIVMENGEEYLFYGKLDELERKLAGHSVLFLRIHQSYLINTEQIQQYHSRHIVMRNRECLSISPEKRTRVTEFQTRLLKKYG